MRLLIALIFRSLETAHVTIKYGSTNGDSGVVLHASAEHRSTNSETVGEHAKSRVTKTRLSFTTESDKNKSVKTLCTQDLLSWAFQVARGMEYLSRRKVLHGDLAARNILLAKGNIVKICDFGLAKTLFKYDKYKKKSNAPLPVRWMAIESIKDGIFSIQSDIWSFGVALWELFTLAENPYPGIDNHEILPKLIQGYRLEKPRYGIDVLYKVMLLCWKVNPKLRPTFTQLVENIGKLVGESVQNHYIELNAPYVAMNVSNYESGTDYMQMMSVPNHVSISPARPENINSVHLSTNKTLSRLYENQTESFINFTSASSNSEIHNGGAVIEKEFGDSSKIEDEVHEDSHSMNI
ncbi:hypothetical protein QAD02_016921 [Eretmocerus hayati]|uniref:Uncharacterized protein n=1 Tax=Eretmocerus hayati TaxID=131215 RepID=A0ACC2PCW2_9HYME|nr:hypothetical protein QAD02_016921 [Eretmocerus hayati]